MCTKNILGDSVLLQMNNIGTKLLKLEDEYCTHRLCGSLHTLVVHGRYKQSLSCSHQCGCVRAEVCPRTATPPPPSQGPGFESSVRVPILRHLQTSLYCYSYRYFYTNTRRAVVMEQFQSKPRPIALWRWPAEGEWKCM